jgi:hypothetical protein
LTWTAGFLVFLTTMQEAQNIVFGPAKALRLGLSIWVAAAVLSGMMLIFAILAWRRTWWRLPGRISFTLVLLGAIGCILWLSHWNLLGWKY